MIKMQKMKIEKVSKKVWVQNIDHFEKEIEKILRNFKIVQNIYKNFFK